MSILHDRTHLPHPRARYFAGNGHYRRARWSHLQPPTRHLPTPANRTRDTCPHLQPPHATLANTANPPRDTSRHVQLPARHLAIPLGATGDYFTDLSAKARYALKAIGEGCSSRGARGERQRRYDLGFVHVKAVDDAGHDKSLDRKVTSPCLNASGFMVYG